MAAPTFVQANAGATDAGGGWVTAGGSLPVSMTIGNLVVLQVLQDGSTSDAVTISAASNGVEALDGTASSLTFVGAFPVGSPTAAIQHLWIGRARATTNSVTVTGANSTSEDVYVRLYEFSGVNTGTALSDVIENSTAGNAVNGAGTGTSVTDTGVTTTGADRLALQFVAVDDDNSLDPFSGESGGDWAEAVAEFAEASGTDGAIQLQTATIASAGTINGGSLTMGASDNWGVVGFALLPAESFTTHFGASVVPLTLNRTVAGFATKAGASNVPLVLNRTVAGFATKGGAAVVPLSFNATTAGAREVSGAAAVPLSVSISTAGTAAKGGASSVGLNATVTTAGFATKGGASAVPLSFNATTAGFKTTASSSNVPLSLTITTAGDIQGNVTGAATLPLAFGATTTGFKTTTSSAAVPLTLNRTTAGFTSTTASLSVPLSITISVAGDIETDDDGTPFRLLMGVGT